MVSIPGPKLAGVAIGTTVIAGICGSASGDLGIAAPLLRSVYLAKGVAVAAIHRTMSISSAALDSLPHNGYLVEILWVLLSALKTDLKWLQLGLGE